MIATSLIYAASQMGKFSISECLCIKRFKNEEQQFDLT